MIINRSNLDHLTRGFKASFQRGFAGVAPLWGKVATLVPSSTASEDYGWLGKIPGMREWIGDRQINNLKQHDYNIKNKSFENTVGVDRDHIDDDQFGIYAPMMETLGQTAAEHPDILVFGLLAADPRSVLARKIERPDVKGLVEMAVPDAVDARLP